MSTQKTLYNLKDLLQQNGLSQMPVAAIGGFDDLQNIAESVSNCGFKILAVSDQASGLVDYGGNGGLNISNLINFKNEGHNFNEYKVDHVKNTKPEFIMKMEVDVLIPEPFKGVLNEDNASDVRARVVLETKRGLITNKAKEILEQKQIPIISLYS